VRDAATFDNPRQVADGIDAVWVNGVLSYRDRAASGERAGRFVPRGAAVAGDAMAPAAEPF